MISDLMTNPEDFTTSYLAIIIVIAIIAFIVGYLDGTSISRQNVIWHFQHLNLPTCNMNKTLTNQVPCMTNTTIILHGNNVTGFLGYNLSHSTDSHK